MDEKGADVRSIKDAITIQYEMARVRGMLGGPGVDPSAKPMLARTGLASIPISALHFPPGLTRHIADNHLLSLDVLCQTTPEYLSEIASHKIRGAYLTMIVDKLAGLGLSLGMNDEQRNAASASPPPALVSHCPFRQSRVEAVPEKPASASAPREKIPAPAPQVSQTSKLPDFITLSVHERRRGSRISSNVPAVKPRDIVADEMQPWLYNLGYVKFSFSQTAVAQQFYDRATAIFSAIIKADPVAAQRCSSRADIMTHPAFLLSAGSQFNRQPFTNVVMSRDMLRVLANEITNHPELVPANMRSISPELKKPTLPESDSNQTEPYDHFGRMTGHWVKLAVKAAFSDKATKTAR